MAKKLDKSVPWVTGTPSIGVTLAIKSLSTGTANEEQQKLALKWIIEELCGTYNQSYYPDSQSDTVFAEGKRFVGNSIVREVNINPAKLRRNEDA